MLTAPDFRTNLAWTVSGREHGRHDAPGSVVLGVGGQGRWKAPEGRLETPLTTVPARWGRIVSVVR